MTSLFAAKSGLANNMVIFFLVGDVVLKDLKLQAEALNSLKLQVIVHVGFVGYNLEGMFVTGHLIIIGDL